MVSYFHERSPPAHRRGGWFCRGAINDYAPGEVLVKFKGMPGGEDVVTLRGANAESFAARLPAMAQKIMGRVKGKALRAFPHMGVVHVKLPGNVSVEEAIDQLEASGTVEFAQPNYVVHAAQTQVLPNDPSLTKQWGLNNTGQSAGVKDADIDALEAWYLKGSDATGAIVVIIDTGVDYNHPDLKANIWKNPWVGQLGYANDLYGINAINGSGNPKDDNGHGTHCAGIAGAAGNNGAGVCGVAWQAQIMGLKFLNAAGSGYEADAIECINYALAVKKKYDSQAGAGGSPRFVMSNSWGGGPANSAMRNALQQVLNQGVLFVAAGRQQRPECGQPAVLPGLLRRRPLQPGQRHQRRGLEQQGPEALLEQLWGEERGPLRPRG